MIKKFFNTVILLFVFFLTTNAQLDTLREISKPEIDTVAQNNKKVRNPKVATIMSGILPGSGQIYNRKYWKAPVIYAFFVPIGYFANHFQKEYKVYYKDLKLVKLDTLGNQYIDGIASSGIDDVTQLVSAYNTTRRYRDISIFAGLIVWTLNVIDAYVDAELSNFDVSDDLSLKINPQMNYFMGEPYCGVSFKFKIR